MRKVTIIRGPLGVGKTTVAKKVCQLSGAHYISIDEVLSENSLLPKSGDIPLKNFLQANKLVLKKVKNFFKDNHACILDGNFYYQEQLDDLEKALGEQLLVITLHASEEACIERDRKRENSLGEESVKAIYEICQGIGTDYTVDTQEKNLDEVVFEVLEKMGI